MDNDIVDPRDTLTVCCVLYAAAVRIGVCPEVIFKRLSQFATLQRRKVFDGFLTGSSSIRSLKSMGVELIDYLDRVTPFDKA